MIDLDIQYGLSNIDICKTTSGSMDRIYVEHKSGMQSCDTSILAKTLEMCTCNGRSLCSLTISNSNINDDILRMTLAGLHYNNVRNHLIHLDVSHNKITTNGLRLLTSYFLDENKSAADCDNEKKMEKGANKDESVLVTFNIADNLIHSEGGRNLGRLLRTNKSLVSINMRLNNLNDEGGVMVIEGLKSNSTLKHLNLASNCLGSKSIALLGTILLLKNKDSGRVTSRLESIDLSSNETSDDDLKKLALSVQENPFLVSLDIRRNHILSSRLKEECQYGKEIVQTCS